MELAIETFTLFISLAEDDYFRILNQVYRKVKNGSSNAVSIATGLTVYVNENATVVKLKIVQPLILKDEE